MLLALGGVVIEVETGLGELEGERPNRLIIINIMRTAENAPNVGKLKAGELHFDKMPSFFVAEEGVGGGIVAGDAVERSQGGSEAVIGLDDDFLLVGAEHSELFGGVFDDGNVASVVGNKEVFGNGARNAPKSIERLASGTAMFDDVADKMRRREAIIPFVDMGEGEADVEPMLVDTVFGVEFAGVFAEVAAPDAFVREKEMAVATDEVQIVLLKKVAGGGFPVIVATDEGFALFAEGENCAAVGVLLDALFLVVDKRSEIFVEQKLGVEANSLSGGGDF